MFPLQKPNDTVLHWESFLRFANSPSVSSPGTGLAAHVKANWIGDVCYVANCNLSKRIGGLGHVRRTTWEGHQIARCTSVAN